MKVGDYIITVTHPKTGKALKIPLKVLLSEHGADSEVKEE